MGVHPKIGITGLPRSGKSAVMEKVLSMIVDERSKEILLRGGHDTAIVGGMRTEPIVENGERLKSRRGATKGEKWQRSAFTN